MMFTLPLSNRARGLSADSWIFLTSVTGSPRRRSTAAVPAVA